MFSVLRFVLKNRELFTTNNEIHQHGTRQIYNFHLPPANLKKYQSGVYYMGIKLYNNLPPYIKMESSDIKKIRISLEEVFN